MRILVSLTEDFEVRETDSPRSAELLWNITVGLIVTALTGVFAG